MTIEMKKEKLQKYIDELNAKGYGFDFDFREWTDSELAEYGIPKGAYWLADCNEIYYYDFAYDSYCMMCECAEEFGFDAPTSYDDDIFEGFRNIIEEDGKGSIDWFDNVMIMFRFE